MRTILLTLLAGGLLVAGVAIGLRMPHADGAPSSGAAPATEALPAGATRPESAQSVTAGAVGVDPSASRRTAITVAAERVGPSVVTVKVTQIRVYRTGPPPVAFTTVRPPMSNSLPVTLSRA